MRACRRTTDAWAERDSTLSYSGTGTRADRRALAQGRRRSGHRRRGVLRGRPRRSVWSAAPCPGGQRLRTRRDASDRRGAERLCPSRTASVTWAQSTVRARFSADRRGGYAVTRYAEGALTSPIVPGASCGGRSTGLQPHELHRVLARDRSLALHGDAVRCTARSRIGGESITTATLIVVPDPPVSVALTNGAGAGNAFINTTNGSSLDFSVTLPTTRWRATRSISC